MIRKIIHNLICLLFGETKNLEIVTEDDVLDFQLTIWFILLVIAVFVTVIQYV